MSHEVGCLSRGPEKEQGSYSRKCVIMDRKKKRGGREDLVSEWRILCKLWKRSQLPDRSQLFKKGHCSVVGANWIDWVRNESQAWLHGLRIQGKLSSFSAGRSRIDEAPE